MKQITMVCWFMVLASSLFAQQPPKNELKQKKTFEEFIKQTPIQPWQNKDNFTIHVTLPQNEKIIKNDDVQRLQKQKKVVLAYGVVSATASFALGWFMGRNG